MRVNLPLPSASSRAALLALGAATAALQTLAIREGMAVAGGNEAVVALLFGVWMLETALGASLGQRRPARAYHAGFALVLYALTMIGTLLAARLSVACIDVGQVPGLAATAAASALLLAPACVLSGWVYAQLARATAAGSGDGLGVASARAYWLDTLGAGVSGVMLALVALDHLLAFRIAGIAAILTIIGAVRLMRRRHRAAALALGISVSLFATLAPVDRWTYRWHAPGQTILEVWSGPHGALLLTESSGQKQVLLQREPVLVPSDHQDGEQTAHLVASLHEHPRRVLVLGIPPGNLLDNLLLHPVTRIDSVVGDERIAAVVRAHAPSGRDDRVRIYGEDVRVWARSAPAASFDLVLILAGAPTTVADARLFSVTFYENIDKLLAPRGLVAVSMPGFAAYASEPERVLHSTVATTLRTSFDHIGVVPADRTLHLASRSPLVEASELASVIASTMRARGIEPEHVSETWLADRLSAERVEQAQRWSSRRLAPSTDAEPVAYRAALRAALARFGDAGNSVLAVLAITLLALLATWVNPRSRPVSFSVAGTGFAGLSLQLLLMLVYQTAVGALYRDVALVTGAYMGASCLGTLLAMRHASTMRRVLVSDAAQLMVAAAIAISVPAMTTWDVLAARLAVVVGALLVGLSTGAQISMATRLPGVFGAGVGGTVYAIDLVGAALAALTTVTFLVPWLGISGAAWSVAGAKLLNSIALARHRSVPGDETRTLRVPLPTLCVLGVAVAVILPASERHLEDWTLSTFFQVMVVAVLAGVLAMAFEPRRLHEALVRAERSVQSVTRRIGMSPLRSLVFLVLLPVAALPIGRCYFSIPYVFCHICPRPCVFGVVRPYVVVTALIANFGDHRFCQRACPLGHAQGAPAAIASTRPRRLGLLSWLLRLVVLVGVAYLYFAVERDSREGTGDVGIDTWFYLGRYGVSASVLAAAGALIVLSFLVRRPFCDAACPIGATSDLVTRVYNWWRRRGRGPW